MRFTLDARAGVNLIRAYSARELRIGETLVSASCIVTAETLITDWLRAAGGAPDVGDLERLWPLAPQILLWGTSKTEQLPSMSVRAALAQRAIAVEVMDLGAACRTFNILVQEERRVAAALFL